MCWSLSLILLHTFLERKVSKTEETGQAQFLEDTQEIFFLLPSMEISAAGPPAFHSKTSATSKLQLGQNSHFKTYFNFLSFMFRNLKTQVQVLSCVFLGVQSKF